MAAHSACRPGGRPAPPGGRRRWRRASPPRAARPIRETRDAPRRWRPGDPCCLPCRPPGGAMDALSSTDATAERDYDGSAHRRWGGLRYRSGSISEHVPHDGVPHRPVASIAGTSSQDTALPDPAAMAGSVTPIATMCVASATSIWDNGPGSCKGIGTPSCFQPVHRAHRQVVLRVHAAERGQRSETALARELVEVRRRDEALVGAVRHRRRRRRSRDRRRRPAGQPRPTPAGPEASPSRSPSCGCRHLAFKSRPCEIASFKPCVGCRAIIAAAPLSVEETR